MRPVNSVDELDAVDWDYIVVAWDLCHNAVGRAMNIADALSTLGSTLIVGPALDRFGGQPWQLLTDSPHAVLNLGPKGLRSIPKAADGLRAGAVVVSKPRITSLLIGLRMMVRRSARQFILDIDDFEAGFSPDTLVSATKSVFRNPAATQDYNSSLYSFASRFLKIFFRNKTYSSSALKGSSRGTIVPHARVWHAYSDVQNLRVDSRKAMALSEDELVLCFVGTEQTYKGLRRVIECLPIVAAAKNSPVQLLVAGTTSKATIDLASRVSTSQIRVSVLGPVSHARALEIVAASDFMMLFQDPNHPASNLQLPAKAIDALSVGTKIWGSSSKALESIAHHGGIFLEPAFPLCESAVTVPPIGSIQEKTYYLLGQSFSIDAASKTWKNLLHPVGGEFRGC